MFLDWLVSAVLAWQAIVAPQLPTSVPLTIKVIDSITGAGIPNATVSVPGVATLRTDATGVCKFDLPTSDSFAVLPPEAEGYRSFPEAPTVTTKSGSGPLILTFSLSRSVSMFGRIVEADTGKPLAGVSVKALLAEYVRGRRSVRTGAGGPVITDLNGDFVLRELVAGDYQLELNASGYPLIHWPGGELNSRITVHAPYGASLGLGEIVLRHRELPSLTVTITGGNCRAGQSYDVELYQSSFTSVISRGKISCPCEGSARFEMVTPGTYGIRAEAPWEPYNLRQSAAVAIRVPDRDASIEIPVTPPIAISGKLRLQEPGDLPADIRVRAWPRGSKLTGGTPHVRVSKMSNVAADGAFETFTYVPPGGEIELELYRLPWSYYAKEIHYQGRVFVGDTFFINPSAARQEVEVVISSGAATVAGAVRTKNGERVLDARVLLTPWPADVVTDYPFGIREADTDVSGSFMFAGIVPGIYRMIGVPAALRSKLEEPGRMLALFEGADSFEVAKSGVVVRELILQ